MKASRTTDVGLVILLLLVLVVGVFLVNAGERRVEIRATGHLQTMLMLRESVLRSYFESLRSEVALWSSRAIVIDILTRLTDASTANDAEAVRAIGSLETSDIDAAAPNRDNASLDTRVREFAEHHQYYDVFFISTEGDVLYTMAKEADYGTNLVAGPYSDTGLGRLFSQLTQSGDRAIAVEDFSLYAPSDNQPAAFLGAKVYSGDRWLGIYAIQIPEQPVNEIMQFSAGMGESGETYLVGKDGLMRSNSRFFDSSTVLKTEVTGSTVGKALAGEEGLEIIEDYRGTPVYSAYRRFEFEGIRWAVLAEQDVAEVRASIVNTRTWLAGAFALLCAIVLMLRFMLIRVALPSSLAALLGLSLVHLDDHD